MLPCVKFLCKSIFNLHIQCYRVLFIMAGIFVVAFGSAFFFFFGLFFSMLCDVFLCAAESKNYAILLIKTTCISSKYVSLLVTAGTVLLLMTDILGQKMTKVCIYTAK